MKKHNQLPVGITICNPVFTGGLIATTFTAFTLVMLLLLFYGCGPSKAELEAKEKAGFKWDGGLGAFIQDTAFKAVPGQSDIEIRTIDGHEYIILKNSGCCSSASSHADACGNNSNVGITHKWNCSSPIHENTDNQ